MRFFFLITNFNLLIIYPGCCQFFTSDAPLAGTTKQLYWV
uniref:Uncharacterized protein n=1 Tax=Rhizophora mucronata TaxID=61149 RepID=A0A2P2QCX6_RHIMU